MKRAPHTVFTTLLRGVAGALPRAPGAARALSAAARPPPPLLSAFPWRATLDTRWEDMDCYNHINNVKFYSFFDTAVNRMLLELGLLALPPSPTSLAGFVVASSCSFLAPLRFPLPVTVGVRVGRLGTSSVSYEVGVFTADGACAATGSFTHAYVNPATHRAQPLPGAMREALQRLCAA
jgi:acyl-CoA thioester hydrolase